MVGWRGRAGAVWDHPVPQIQLQDPSGSSSCCSSRRLSWGMPEFGSAGSRPGPALLPPGLPQRGDDCRESFSWIGCWLTCFFCWKAGRAWMVLGAGGGVVLLTTSSGEEETPKPSPCSARTRWNRSRSTCIWHLILFLPVPASQGSWVAIPAALPFPGCSPEPIPPS